MHIFLFICALHVILLDSDVCHFWLALSRLSMICCFARSPRPSVASPLPKRVNAHAPHIKLIRTRNILDRERERERRKKRREKERTKEREKKRNSFTAMSTCLLRASYILLHLNSFSPIHSCVRSTRRERNEKVNCMCRFTIAYTTRSLSLSSIAWSAR